MSLIFLNCLLLHSLCVCVCSVMSPCACSCLVGNTDTDHEEGYRVKASVRGSFGRTVSGRPRKEISGNGIEQITHHGMRESQSGKPGQQTEQGNKIKRKEKKHCVFYSDKT